jgi:ABC-type uncharacterized transport system substrate-binding protein
MAGERRGARMRTRALHRSLSILAALAVAGPALAHPHVWVTARAELVYAADGKITAVRHRWTFDPGYSAYVTQGLGKDGKPTPEELQDLAKTNAESLAEFGYFTEMKVNGAKQAFSAPRDYGMVVADGQATLSLVLPLKTPAAPKLVALEVFDPSFFVSFDMAPGDDAIRLDNAPAGCAASVTRPKPVDGAPQQNMSEAFFQAMTNASAYGAQFSSRIIVACP